MTPRRLAVLVCAFAAMLCACAGSRIGGAYTADGKDFDFRHPHCENKPPYDPSKIAVRYLGSGGVAITWQEQTILLGPYFSHAGSLVAAKFYRVSSDAKRIDDGLKEVPGRVVAIVLGHAHFDHMADVPEVEARLAQKVPVYVNESGRAALGSFVETRKLTAGESFDAGPFHVTPYAWDHAPQLCHHRFFPCTYAPGEFKGTAQEKFAHTKMSALRGGATFAFVIDLIDPRTQQRAFRIYYNDSAGSDRVAKPPDVREVDLAILCMASFHNVHGYPESVLSALQPRHVLISHYDDFFKKQQDAWSFAPLLTNHKAERFMRRLKANLPPDGVPPAPPICGPSTARWSMPVPNWPLYFSPETSR